MKAEIVYVCNTTHEWRYNWLHLQLYAHLDMHHNRSISTLSTPFDHFQKCVFDVLILRHLLRCRHIYVTQHRSGVITGYTYSHLHIQSICHCIEGPTDQLGDKQSNAHRFAIPDRGGNICQIYSTNICCQYLGKFCLSIKAVTNDLANIFHFNNSSVLFVWTTTS